MRRRRWRWGLFQGCSYPTNGGDVPDDDQWRVCPEDLGNEILLCVAACGGGMSGDKICDLKTNLGGGYYKVCACCPDVVTLGCKAVMEIMVPGNIMLLISTRACSSLAVLVQQMIPGEPLLFFLF